MEFGFSDEQRLLAQSFRRFLEREIRPQAQEYRDTMIPKEVCHDLLKKLIPYGFVVGSIPEADGGMGLDQVTIGLLYEDLSRVFAGLAGVAMISDTAAAVFALDATPGQKERYLRGIGSADIIPCLAISEPDVGSNPTEIRTRAAKDGAGYRISGQKAWISNGAVSDICYVVARTGGERNRSLSRFIVEREPAGYTARNVHKIGLNGWSTAELFFDNAYVAAENMVGDPGSGLKTTLQIFERARCFLAVMSVGIAQAALDASIQYARERKQWGKPIGQHQMIQNMIAEMATELDCARLLTYRGFYLLDQGARCDTQTSMAKYYATEVAVNITSKAIEIHGGYGLTKEFPLEQYFRDARVMTIPDGTSEIQKLIVARNLLGLSAF